MNALLELLKAILPLVERLLIYLKGRKDGQRIAEIKTSDETLANVAKCNRIRNGSITADDAVKLRDKYSRK